MPKLRNDDIAFDLDELEEADYTEGDFETYDGPVPPNDTVLNAYLKSMWWTSTRNDDDMIKAVLVAADNEGDLEEYNGLPMWENLALITTAKFKWKPFIDQFGFTLKDIKTKTIVSDEEHPTFGLPIEKIGSFRPGEDSDAAWCRVVTKRGHNQDGDLRAEIRKLLDYEESEDEPEEDEPEEEEYEEDVQEEPEDEEDTPEPPARGRGRRSAPAAAKPAAARGAARGRSAPAPAATRSPGRRAAPARSAAAKAASPAPAKRGRRSAAPVDDNEPPF